MNDGVYWVGLDVFTCAVGGCWEFEAKEWVFEKDEGSGHERFEGENSKAAMFVGCADDYEVTEGFGIAEWW